MRIASNDAVGRIDTRLPAQGLGGADQFTSASSGDVAHRLCSPSLTRMLRDEPRSRIFWFRMDDAWPSVLARRTHDAARRLLRIVRKPAHLKKISCCAKHLRAEGSRFPPPPLPSASRCIFARRSRSFLGDAVLKVFLAVQEPSAHVGLWRRPRPQLAPPCHPTTAVSRLTFDRAGAGVLENEGEPRHGRPTGEVASGPLASRLTSPHQPEARCKVSSKSSPQTVRDAMLAAATLMRRS